MLNYNNKYILPIFIYKRRPGPDPCKVQWDSEEDPYTNYME